MCEVIGVEYNQRAYKLTDGKQVTTRFICNTYTNTYMCDGYGVG